MRGEGPVADLMATRFQAAKRRYGLNLAWTPMDMTKFRVPPKPGSQIDLFG